MPNRLFLIALLIGSTLPISCRQSVATPSWHTLRPAAGLGKSSALDDAYGIRYTGIEIPHGRPFSWRLPAGTRGNLRFVWSSPGANGPVVLTVKLPSGDAIHVSRPLQTAGGRTSISDEDIQIIPGPEGTLEISCDGGRPLFLSDLRVVHPGAENQAAVLLVIDTLRRDAVGLYGSRRPSTPNLDRIFLNAWKADRAYSAASWTIPSVASLLTGLPPRFQEDLGLQLGVPPDTETIASDFQRAGWSTAWFDANPTLNTTNGFDQGFATFYTPPYVPSSMTLPGAHMLPAIRNWLRAHRGEQFFLMIQLIDPHEPYGPPDRPIGKTPFDPDYRGSFTGHESYSDLMFVKKPAPRDVEHLHALYEDDVRYSDSVVGSLWNSMESDLRSRATFVLTADHGEEFQEHRGLMHGPSLYDEVLHVPLMVREGNGRHRLNRTGRLISLLDVRPLLRNLLLRNQSGLDALADRAILPPITMLTGGAARAVVIRNGSMLTFFDRLGVRGVPDAKADPGSFQLALFLRTILPSMGRFDLARDPGETNLLPPDPATLPDDWGAIETSIAHMRQGVELRVTGGGKQGKLKILIEGAGQPAEGFALDDDDTLRMTPKGVELDASVGPTDVDGLLIPIAGESLHVALLPGSDCAMIPALSSRRFAAGNEAAIPIASAIPHFTFGGECPSIEVWRASGQHPVRTPAERAEYVKKLRSIGYLQ